MLQTIRHQDTGPLVVVAKLLTGYLRVTEKISDPDSYIKANGLFDAHFVAHVVSWQSSHGATPDGVIGPATWTAIAKSAPTCSTAKNRISGATMACQILVGGNLVADAIYGSRTKAAVATVQDSHGLVVDGICGPRTWGALITQDDVAPEPVPTPQPTPGEFHQPVDYKQGDPRWGKKMYSNHGDHSQTMANSGCGPTAMADVVATLKNPAVTPWTLAQLAMEWGDRTYNSGTAWSFFPHIAKNYHFSKMVQTKSFDALKSCLDAGGYVVCSMGPGYWTKSGHFICAWKYDSTYVYCNDPASSSRKKQKISAFKSESKQYFCFYPDPKPEPAKEPTDSDEAARGDKILDISHHQPTVDYDGITGDTALIILRAGYRGTGGGIKMDTCFEKNASELKKRGVRFGVYFYSIATSATKARDEAAAFYDWAKPYDPLFWAVDLEVEEITAAAIRAWAEAMRGFGVTKLGAYVAHHLYKDYGFDDLRGLFDFVWIPRYGSKAPDYKCDLWQYTSTGSVDGIGGNVDLSRVTGDGHGLEWFCGGDEA